MLKKCTIFFLLTMVFSLGFVNRDFAQVKKAPVKKTSTIKKAVPAAKTVQAKPVTVAAPAMNGGKIRVKIITDSGTMIIRLYDSTPLHRDNFVKLVSQGFYDSLLFHRIIPSFMIQGGDPLSKNAVPGTMLGSGGGDMARIPAEFKTGLYHKKGALAAARDGNPEKASSACQFYVVDGKTWTDQELDMMEGRTGRKYTPEQRNVYKTLGGAMFLDNEYTVFGEVESGIEVISKIANVPRDASDRPLADLRMRIELVK
jgi:cyclophilin family peptidyl-prolyl cis-trans isomerase